MKVAYSTFICVVLVAVLSASTASAGKWPNSCMEFTMQGYNLTVRHGDGENLEIIEMKFFFLHSTSICRMATNSPKGWSVKKDNRYER